MYKLTISTLRKLFLDSYNRGYNQAVMNMNLKRGEPVGNEVEQEEFLQSWIKKYLG